ncbi:MAG TPA: hypothetical protein VIV58_05215 [Kofleriaceae bacterium]
MKTILCCLVTLTLGCQTTFTGDPHIDPGQCQAKCQATRMEMAGMVYMGEYSSACLCEVPKPPQGAPGAAGPSDPRRTLLLGDAGAGGATAGVIMQMRRAQEQRNQGYIYR